MMLHSRKARFALAALVIALVLGGVACYILSSRTFYADLVLDRVKAAFEDAGGYSLETDSLEGNPLTGVSGGGVRITHDGVPIATADKVDLSLSLPSVVTSNPKLSEMAFTGLSADYTMIMDHLPKEKKESSGAPPALDRLTVRDSNFMTPWGAIGIKRASITLGDGHYGVTLNGTYEERPLRLRAAIDMDQNGIRARQFDAEWDSMNVKASGTVSPDLEIDADVSNLDLDALAERIPAIRASTVRGVYSGKFRVFGGDRLSVKGDLTSAGGRVWKLPFESLRTGIEYAGNTIVLSDLTAKAFGGVASADGSLTLVPGNSPQLSISFQAQSLDTRKALADFPWLEQFPGIIDSASGNIQGPVNALSGSASLQAKQFQVAGFDCTDVRANVGLKAASPIRVAFSGTSMGATAVGSGDIAISPNVLVGIGMEISPISLAEMGKHYPQLADMNLSGTGTAHIDIQGPASALAFSGNADFPSLSVGDAYHLSAVSGKFQYSADKGIVLDEARVFWNDALITASGGMVRDSRGAVRGLDFKGNLSNFQISSLENQVEAVRTNNIRGNVAGNWTLTGTAENPLIGFDVGAPILAMGEGIAVTDVRAAGSYQDGRVTFSKLTLNQEQGIVNAAGTLRLPSENLPMEYNIEGYFENIDPEELAAIGGISADVSGDLDGTLRVWKDGTTHSGFRVGFKNSALRYGNVLIPRLEGAVALEDGSVKLENLYTYLITGYIRLNGTVSNVLGSGREMRSDDMRINMTASIVSADVGRMTRIYSPTARGFQGQITGSADIRGTVDDPSFTADGGLFGVRAFGLLLPRIQFSNISGNMREINFPNVRAVIVGRGAISADGALRRENDVWGGRVKASGKNVDIRSLTFSLASETRRSITGKLDFDFEGSGTLEDFEGGGSVWMPQLSVMGIKLTDVKAPFWVTEGFATVEESSAKAYGGDVSVQVAKDLKLSRWGGRLGVLSADLASAFADLMPDAEGSITGKADLMVRIGGDSRRTSMQDASGSLEVTNGEILGFSGAAAVSRLIGGRPLRFSSALGSFSVDGKTLYILPGSRVSAPKGDPVFKYIMMDGSVGMEDLKVDLSCIGNVNIRALNTFVGGVQGVLSAAMDNRDINFEDFIGGAITGFSRNEFRDVSLLVRGQPDNIRFEKVEIAAPTKYETMPDGLSDSEDPRHSEFERIQIRLEFPVGPGGEGMHDNDNIGGQVGGQVLEQAIKGILTF